MGIKKKYAKGRLDKYYYMAKEQGYRARSAFKLIQLNKKYNFLEKSKCLVDLCAAPGGWLQVAAKYIPKPNIIIGLDLAAIKPIPGVITHVEDITTQKCRGTLKKELKTWKADVFLHDGAPNVGTSWAQDAFTQSELVLASLRLAVDFLVAGGTFVTKVFRSKDYNKLIWVFNQLFAKVEATKPASSRNVSAEIFVVCREFLAPAKIDPKFLDPKHVFKELDDVSDEKDEKKRKEKQGMMLNNILHPEKKTRHREGYADGDYTLHVTTSITDFVQGRDFLDLLARTNKFSFGGDDFGKILRMHPLTNEEIKACCQDLKVLGRKEFKELLRWREAIRLDLGLDKKKEKISAEEENEEEEEDLETQIENEAMSAATRAKREKRKARERKAKQLIRLRLGMGTPSDIGLEAGDAEGLGGGEDTEGGLFHISSTKPSKAKPVTEDREIEFDVSSDEENAEEWSEEGEDDEVYDSDEEVARKVHHLESELDGLFDQFRERRMERDPTARVRRKKESSAAFEEWYGTEYDKKLKDADGAVGKDGSDSDSESSDDDDDNGVEMEEAFGGRRSQKRKAADVSDEESDASDDGLVDKSSMSKRARVFFDNPLFQDAEKVTTGVKRKAEVLGGKGGKGLFAREMVDAGSDTSDDEEEITAMAKKQKKARKSKDGALDEDAVDIGFEVVSTRNLNAGEAGKDDFAIDSAEAYTLAQQLLRKSSKRDLIDSSFNRYAFNDTDDLPSWFREDENNHNKPSLPVSKEAVAIIKQRMQALDARPIKKVAEAKFRKQLRTQRRMEKMLKKTAALNEDEDTSEKSKLMSIAKLAGKAKAKPKEKKVELVVAKGANKGNKGRPKGVKGRYKMVDPRMKKEIRAMKRKQGSGKRRK
ncbi:AdoMet-dependent rRNA methyltransferase spb1 [Borealophlyctis nickersoniae]|nr:AdoMet-dependent rRNA methyltransferase spb1 [Borealophlyctis nickersoniae]